ncbi:conserved hypothetical protein [Ricinus communis]|uniref:Uncharacterized protein n=1 Tax=Ricinus communis TaxID=3988 RepID=B9SZ74_RICCO|nr:conserved hypothetical protein [Ricinus communis]
MFQLAEERERERERGREYVFRETNRRDERRGELKYAKPEKKKVLVNWVADPQPNNQERGCGIQDGIWFYGYWLQVLVV